MKETLNFRISRNADNLHEESFGIPYKLKTLYLNIDLPDECRYMAFVILKDEMGAIRLQKLLGYGEQKLAVGALGEHTSIGGVTGAINPGTWTLGIGIFTEYMSQRLGDKEFILQVVITEEECEITEPIGSWMWLSKRGFQIDSEKYNWEQVYQSGARWYKGDFHTHTRLSDGKETVVNAMKKAEDMEMDFYVPTEHNLIHTGWCNTKLCIIPGVEITTDKGHFNLFGITDMPEKLMDIVMYNGKPQMEQYVDEVIKEANRKGWIISLNHPFLTIWKWLYGKTDIKDFQCVEIINDPTYQDATPSNEKAIVFLDALWQDGHKICGVGGSDSHNLIEERYEGADLPSIVGDPGTYVFCETLTPKAVLESVRKCHVCVTRFCRIYPDITVDGVSYLPGDEFPVKQNHTKEFETEKQMKTVNFVYEAKICDLEEKPQVFIVKNGQKFSTKVLENEDGEFFIKEQVLLENEEWNWIRLDVRKQDGTFLGYVNPVYYGKKQSRFKTVEEIWQHMGDK
ncbi:MAG: CehA/McbA family metallohydrolase [Lachnospiraceae bacterium]|nr:CehA/McbA family metallohydrolase [Lachnospiraceae bacterium]